MMYIDDATIDRWIQEDAPYLDLTTHLLGIGSRPGRLTLRARTDLVVCGTDEARRVLGKLGANGGGQARAAFRIGLIGFQRSLDKVIARGRRRSAIVKGAIAVDFAVQKRRADGRERGGHVGRIGRRADKVGDDA